MFLGRNREAKKCALGLWQGIEISCSVDRLVPDKVCDAVCLEV